MGNPMCANLLDHGEFNIRVYDIDPDKADNLVASGARLATSAREAVTGCELVSDQDSIMAAWTEFYKQLFTAEPVDLALQDRLLDHLESQLSPAEAASWEGCLSLEEAHTALAGMARYVIALN